MIELDVKSRKLTLNVQEGHLAERRAVWSPPQATADRGMKLCPNLVQQPDKEADFDLLRGGSGSAVAKDLH